MGPRSMEYQSYRSVYVLFPISLQNTLLTMPGPYSIAIGNVAAWLGMPAISPDGHEDLAAKLEAQDHAAQLPPDTDPTVIAVRKPPFSQPRQLIRAPSVHP